MKPVPAVRIEARNQNAVNAGGEFVLYWMTMYRRAGWNFSLQRAVEWAERLRRPLVILEALSCTYPWASERLHRFVLDGMAENARAFAGRRVLYYPYVEPRPRAGKGLLAALAARACVVVADDYPCFFLPRLLAAAAAGVPCMLEAVDSNGLLPLRAAPKAFVRAFDFRRFLGKHLAPHLEDFPAPDPLRGARLPAPAALPESVLERWPPGAGCDIARLPIDHAVAPAPMRGGTAAARVRLARFAARALARYGEDARQPELDATSRLSPYLHFGHLSAHEVHARVAKRKGAAPFLDQLVTWRELGFNYCAKRPAEYDRYESLPHWARATLAAHARDPRPHRYDLDALERGRTHDPVWNAAQGQLLQEGWFHNSMRMLWGKKILEWSPTPQDALQAMIHLMNRHSLDGRDPNSYSGIFWTLGRYDRAWGPERPIFGKIRYMSSANTARKLRLARYVQRYAP